MAASITLLQQGRLTLDIKTNATEVDDVYLVSEAANQAEAMATTLSLAPSTLSLGAYSAFLKTISIDEHGNGYWSATTHYSAPELQAGSLDFSMDTTGGTAHITSARSTRNRYTYSGATAIDDGVTIGDDQEGNVAGLDISVPAFRMEVIKVIEWSAFNQALINSYYHATGKINSTTFNFSIDDDHPFSFAAGEILFMGARANRRKDLGLVEIGLGFLGSANVTSLLINDITVATKKGHDYLDIRYLPRWNSTTWAQPMAPHTVTVRQVYDELDLNGIV